MSTAPLLLTAEVADLLRVSERTLRAWAKSGLIPCVHIIKEMRFRREDVDTILLKGLQKECSQTYTPKKLKPRSTRPELMAWERKPAK